MSREFQASDFEHLSDAALLHEWYTLPCNPTPYEDAFLETVRRAAKLSDKRMRELAGPELGRCRARVKNLTFGEHHGRKGGMSERVATLVDRTRSLAPCALEIDVPIVGPDETLKLALEFVRLAVVKATHVDGAVQIRVRFECKLPEYNVPPSSVLRLGDERCRNCGAERCEVGCLGRA